MFLFSFLFGANLERYVGFSAGLTSNSTPFIREQVSQVNPLLPPSPETFIGCYAANNATVSVHGGIRKYFNRVLFLGFDGAAGYTTLGDIDKTRTQLTSEDLRVQKQFSYNATVHFGKRFNRWIAYLKAGVNVAQVRHHYIGDATWDSTTVVTPFTDNKDLYKLGGLFGLGVEYDWKPNLRIGTELTYNQVRKYTTLYQHQPPDERVQGTGFSTRSLELMFRLSWIF